MVCQIVGDENPCLQGGTFLGLLASVHIYTGMSLVFLDELPDNIPVPLLRAEVLLYQIMGGCFENSSVFYGPKNQIRDPICKLCGAGVKETMEHIIIYMLNLRIRQSQVPQLLSSSTTFMLTMIATATLY